MSFLLLVLMAILYVIFTQIQKKNYVPINGMSYKRDCELKKLQQSKSVAATWIGGGQRFGNRKVTLYTRHRGLSYGYKSKEIPYEDIKRVELSRLSDIATDLLFGDTISTLLSFVKSSSSNEQTALVITTHSGKVFIFNGENRQHMSELDSKLHQARSIYKEYYQSHYERVTS